MCFSMFFLSVKTMRRYSKYNIPAAAVIALALLIATASCGSSRNASRGGQAYHTEKSGQNSSKKTSSKYGNVKTHDTLPRHIDFTSVKLAPAAEQLLREADSWIGTPYRWGGNDRNGVDCSGFVTQVFRNSVGISLPRTSGQQHDFCLGIDRDDLQPGDLVFFTVRGGSSVGHVGIYIGNGQIVHSSSSKGVIISSLSANYYKVNYHSSGRVEKYFAMASGNQPKRAAPQGASASSKGKSARHTDSKASAVSTPVKASTPAETKAEITADNAEKKNIQQVASARTSRIGKLTVEPASATSPSENPTENEADELYDFFD